MKKKIIIFTEEEMKKIKLEKKDNYYILNKEKINKKRARKYNKK